MARVSKETSRRVMNELFHKFSLNSLEDWKFVTKKRILRNSKNSLHGENIFSQHQNNKRKLLISLYPNYPWNFSNIIHTNKYFKEIDNQRLYMNQLFKRLELKELDEWKKITRNKLIEYGATSILKHYNNSIEKLLEAVYPEHEWGNFKGMRVYSPKYFKPYENRRMYLEQLFHRLKIQSLEDFKSFSRKRFVRLGAYSLLKLYKNDINLLLQSIYPNYPWKSLQKQPRDLKLLQEQRCFLNELFIKLKLSSLDDFVHLPRKFIITQQGGLNLLYFHYKNNYLQLLMNVYPNFPFSQLFTAHLHQVSRNTLLFFLKKYDIREKSDWYRLSFRDFNEAFRILKRVYPDECWNSLLLRRRSKRSSQRLLFSVISRLFPRLLILENYKHALIRFNSDSLEFDVFIPSLNFAVEYQGEQHFDDIPSCFSSQYIYQLRDVKKHHLSILHSISLLHIPYWWDFSSNSLLPSIRLI